MTTTQEPAPARPTIGRGAYRVTDALTALDGITSRLTMGADVADLSCGRGSTTILMAQVFPRSRFVGSDVKLESIEIAQFHAQVAGVADQTRFEISDARSFTGRAYELVTSFAGLLNLDDPLAAAQHVRDAIGPHGTWMIAESLADPARVREVTTSAGFTRFRLAAETETGILVEARP
jgi:trans-aconitate methyltransferase